MSYVELHPDDFRKLPCTRYDPATGAILDVGPVAVNAIDRMERDNGWHVVREAATYDRHYVDLATKTIRTKAPCTATLNGMTMSNIPPHSAVRVTGPTGPSSTHHIIVPEVELSFDFPGTYRVRVTSVQCLPGEYEVVVP